MDSGLWTGVRLPIAATALALDAKCNLAMPKATHQFNLLQLALIWLYRELPRDSIIPECS